MNKRMQREYSQRHTLRHNGWDVPKRDAVAFNGTSETLEHYLCKSLVAYVMKQRGFRVASEVEGPGGEIDVLAYGQEDPPLAIECETGLTDEIKSQKIGQYVRGTPIRDCLFLEVQDLPETLDEALDWVGEQL